MRRLVCLLNAAELRSLGIKCNYGAEVSRAGIEFVHYPIVEGAGAGDHIGTMEAAHAVVVDAVSVLQRGDSSVLHCRGGVGRAGMVGACLLLLTGEATTPKQAIGLIRKRRCKQAVETRRQEDFVTRYFVWLVETGVLEALPDAVAPAATRKGPATAAATSAEERRAAAELRRRQVKERREAARANAKVLGGGGGAAGDGGGGVACSGKNGCVCADCAASAAMLNLA